MKNQYDTAKVMTKPIRKLDWNNIHTVLLDMDGTLLDQYFDNHFWQEHLPLKWGAQRGLDPDTAKAELLPRFQAVAGTLNWYCLDYWSGELELDIAELKRELSHLIRVRPGVHDFLHFVRGMGKRMLLVTNAHGGALELKMLHTDIAGHFDRVVSSHELGSPKESQAFWMALQKIEAYDEAKTLLIDDSLEVLNAAREFGIRYLVAISKPDSRYAARDMPGFDAVESLVDLLD